MTLQTSLIITGDTEGAQRALDDLDRAIRETGASTDNLSRTQDAAATSTEGLSKGAKELGGALVDAAAGAATGGNGLDILSQQGAKTTQAVAGLTLGTQLLSGAMSFGLTIAITGAMSLLGVLVTKLLSGGDAAEDMGERQRALGDILDKTTGKIRNQVAAVVALAEAQRQANLLDQQRADYVRSRGALIAYGRTAGRGEFSSNLFAPGNTATRTDTESERQIKALAEQYRRGTINANAFGVAVKKIGDADPAVKKVAEHIVELASGTVQGAQAAEKTRANIALLTGTATDAQKKLLGITAEANTALLDAQAKLAASTGTVERAQAQLTVTRIQSKAALDSGAISEAEYSRRVGDAEKAVTSARDAERAATGARRASGAATREAAKDARALAGDLVALEKKYDPVAAAARAYRKELEDIANLEAAGKIDGKTADDWSGQARRAYFGGKIDIGDLGKQATQEEQELDRARAAIDGLIESLNTELAVRQALDPVQAEMIKHRKELAALPEAERGQAEADLRKAVAANAAMDDLAERTREAARAQYDLGRAAVGALDDIIVGGESAGRTIKRLAQSIASATLEASLLGTGPLAAMLGTSAGRGQTGGALGLLLGRGKAAAAPTTGNDTTTQTTADVIGKSVGKEVGSEFDRSMQSVFGQNGSFAGLLRNAGMGYIAGSVTGSGTGGAIGGALGGFAAEKLLSSTLGSLAGPIGSIAGGLLGGVVGGLFKKEKNGSTALTFDGGVARIGAVSGKGSEAKQAAQQFGQDVADTLNSIVKQLGGSLGSARVSVGYRPGHKAGVYRVDPTGAGGIAGGPVLAFDSQQAALNYAIMDAIKDGAVTGLSAAVQKALKSSTDIDRALQEALKVQEVETAIGGIGGEMAKAFKDFEAQAKERLRIARAYGFDVVKIEELNNKERLDLQKQFVDQQVGSLQRLVDSMTAGSLFEGSAVEHRQALLDQIGKAQADLDSGVEGAGDTLAGLLEQFNQVSKQAYGTTGGFAADRNAILDQARAAIAKANEQVAAAEKTSDPALATTNAALDENNAQNARMIAALDANNALLGRLASLNSQSAFDLSQLARTTQ
ncbi:hypothetical protein DFR49_2277 [Hephaestia caeni]|uniref:Tail length tape measure protein n=1 Tax=Hephaestia caeni TaxID=645617 RepID=A0A397PEF8_9SPHN|nr:hypothetical protein [Hephaestia caeni]RIA44041.1 hypothetical protein DFR49_2277 [Hephaestia caeni]